MEDLLMRHGIYFVLKINSKDPHHAVACQAALATYANKIEAHLPELSEDLLMMLLPYLHEK